MNAKIQRYTTITDDGYATFSKHPEGNVVLHADHLARVQELEQEVERLKLPYAGYSFADLGEAEETIRQLEREVQREHEDCCKLSTAVVDLTAERDSLKAQLAALSWQPKTIQHPATKSTRP